MSDWSNDYASRFTAQLVFMLQQDSAQWRPPTHQGPSSGGGGFSSGPREPARLSDVLLTLGIIVGVTLALSGVLLWPTDQMLFALVVGAAVAAPFFTCAWLLRTFSKARGDRLRAGPWTVLVRWVLIGLGVGLSLGVATPVLLGADISAMEGVRVFAPAGVLLGAVIGVFRRPKRAKAG